MIKFLFYKEITRCSCISSGCPGLLGWLNITIVACKVSILLSMVEYHGRHVICENHWTFLWRCSNEASKPSRPSTVHDSWRIILMSYYCPMTLQPIPSFFYDLVLMERLDRINSTNLTTLLQFLNVLWINYTLVINFRTSNTHILKINQWI